MWGKDYGEKKQASEKDRESRAGWRCSILCRMAKKDLDDLGRDQEEVTVCAVLIYGG